MDTEEKETTPSIITSSSSSTCSTIRPTAFTIDFGNEKKVDLARQKSLTEKFQQRHKRGKSMSKLDEGAPGVAPVVSLLVAKKPPLSGNLPRKSSFYQLDQGSSAEAKPERCTISASKRSDLRLPLENINSDLMTHSFPNQIFSSSSLFNNNNNSSSDNLHSQQISSSPEFNNKDELLLKSFSAMNLSSSQVKNFKQQQQQQDHESDTVSEAGTYTLDVDYSEEQKARMSIDKEFKIEKISVEEKAAEYIKSLSVGRYLAHDDNCFTSPTSSSQISCCSSSTTISSTTSGFLLPPVPPLKKTQQLNYYSETNNNNNKHLELLFKKTGDDSINNRKLLSPIMSPTQNISLIDDNHIQTIIKNPVSSKMKSSDNSDEGTVISVSSSGAFKNKNEEKLKLEEKKRNLSKSAVHVEAYVDGKIYNDQELMHNSKRISKLTANIVNIQSIEVNNSNNNNDGAIVSGSFSFGKAANITTGLPPPSPGKCSSPSKIPSPIHTLSPRPRSRINSPSGDDFDTEMILKPTRNFINSLQHKLSLDNNSSGDQDSDYDMKYGLQLNNTAHLLNKQRSLHTRHNSLDDRTMMINNKLEHFQSKNLQSSIDQTYNTNNVFSQYHRNNSNKIVNKINNSPNNSPAIRRSSSFSSNRNHQMNNVKISSNNIIHMMKKDSPNNLQIHRSSSTACIKPDSVTKPKNNEHRRIDRNQFGDTETSSEDDVQLEANNLQQKKKDLGSLSNTRCNRTFSLRRARIDNADAANKMNKCPNTPDMRRRLIQHQPVLSKERAISVDRKPVKTTEVQSRYLLSLNKRASSIAKEVPIKNVPKITQLQQKTSSSSSANFSRNEGGRFSMRAPKPTTTTTTTTMSNNSIVPNKPPKKDRVKNNSKQHQNGGGGRCNSSLSSREVEFQNWKRRKSYDPMKAAKEGKKKELEKRLINEIANNTGNKPINTSPDSSPSHSGSVHRSQSFHGTAALGQLLLISSDDEDDDDLTFSNDEGFSPPTPSPCELSPSKKTGLLKNSLLWERLRN